MRLALMRLQSSNVPPGKPAKGSLDAALAKVSTHPLLGTTKVGSTTQVSTVGVLKCYRISWYWGEKGLSHCFGWPTGDTQSKTLQLL